MNTDPIPRQANVLMVNDETRFSPSFQSNRSFSLLDGIKV
jgi:hypothetical protein